MKQRSRKAKGTRLEKWIVEQLKSIGISARKQPMSGALQDFPHDVCGTLPDGRFIVEAKSWKHGWRTGDKAMGAADCLVMKRDYATPAVYMSWEFFARLVGLANGGREDIVSEGDALTTPRPVSEGADSDGHFVGIDCSSQTPFVGLVPTGPTNVPQSLLTGKSGKPRPKPNKWGRR